MSTAFASDDGGKPVLGLDASPARAFLHALATKLHNVADGIVHRVRTTTTRIAHVARALASRTASVISLAFTQGGLRASIGLLVTAGQITAYAVQAGAERATVAAHRATQVTTTWVRSVTTTIKSPHGLAPATRLPRNLWIIASTLIAAVILAASIAISRRRGRHPRTPENLGPNLTTEERARLATSLFVVLGSDGAVRVHGIPVSLPPDDRATIAETAARAAENRLEALVARGRPMTELDMCAINIAARNAVTRLLDDGDLAA